MAIQLPKPKALAQPAKGTRNGGRLSGQKNKVSAVLLMLLLFLGNTAFAQLSLENFGSGIPATWAQINSGSSSINWGTSTDGYLDTSAAYINPGSVNIGAGNTSTHYLVTPLVTVPANGEISFYTKQNDNIDHGNIYQVRISTAGQTDPSGFSTILATWTEAQLNTVSPIGYEHKTVTIPSSITPGIGVYIAFVVINDQPGASPDADAWYIDNVSVATAEVCDPVLAANFTTSNVSTTTATLSWTHPSATNFQIQIVADGATPGTVGTATGSTYNASGLTANTNYDVYIKALCSSSSSTWAGPFNLTTLTPGMSCNAPIVIPATGSTYTYTGNLNTFQNASLVYSTQGSNCLSPSITQNYLNGAKAFFSYTPTTDGLVTMTQIVPTASLNAFSSLLVYDSCASVGVSCLAGTLTVAKNVLKVIPNFPVQANHTYIIVVSSQLAQTASITFTFTLNPSTCPTPGVISYNNLQQNSVKFSWNNVNNYISNWQYAVVAAGAAAPTTGTSTTTNTDNLISGLTANTSYDFYVRPVCGGTPGAWSIAYRFKTQCSPYSTPYSTNFTGATAAAPQACWTGIDVNADGTSWTYLSSYATMQTNTYQNDNNDMFVTPQVVFTGAQKRLRFKHQVVGGVSSYSIKLSTTGVGYNDFTYTLMPETQITNTTWQEKIINIPASISGNVNIAFIVTPGSGSTATRISIDDVYIEDKPACSDPITPTVANITTTGASLSWTLGDVETQWQVVVQPAGTGIPTTNTGIIANTNTNFAVTGLNPATQYEYYVRAYCNDTQQSNWVGPVAFTTLCAVFEVPYTENFNDTDLVNSHQFCWSTLNANNDGPAWSLTSTTQASIQMPLFGTVTGFDDWLISPAINVQGTKALKFNYKALVSAFFTTARFGVEVLMSTTDTNPSSFSVIMPLMEFTNTDYLEKSLFINANGPVYIAFRVPPTYVVSPSSIFYLDDVRIEDAPDCPDPSALAVSNVGINSADMSWDAGFIETQWQVAIQPQGTGVPTTGTMVTSNNYSITTLTADTNYEVYIRAYCNDTDQSDWIGPVNFKTLCEAYPSPFIETFNPDSATEHCWVVRNDNNDVGEWNMNSNSNPYEGTQAAGIFTGFNGANDDWLISPTITVTANQRLRYYYRVFSSEFTEDLEVKLSTTGITPADFTTTLYTTDTDTTPLNNEQYKVKIINLPAGITGNINIGFHIPQETPNAWGYRGQLLVIDNVIIEDRPACPAPVNLTTVTIGDTQVQLGWDSVGSETAWDVYVQPAGIPAPVGNGNAAYLTSVTTNPATISGLTAATQYDYYVRAACSDTEDSEWSQPFTFTTMCPLDTACEYTFTLTNPLSGGLSGEVQVIQNQLVVASLDLTSTSAGATNTFTVFLCDGVEFSLLWDGIGYVPGNSASTVLQITKDGQNVWTSPAPFGPMNDIIYTGFASCSPVTCPMPTNLAAAENGTLTWTAGGSETQWEVFIQPLDNGTLPQSGILVNTPSYIPTASDFSSVTAGTYEFFVRAVCGTNNTSFWSGAKSFVRNDSAQNAIVIPVNSGEQCVTSGEKASFAGATASAEATTCAGTNNGDIWYEFTATSTAHIIELVDFSGVYYISTGNPAHPAVTMTLYHVNGSTLEQMACSTNNTLLAAYSTATIAGETYKIRLTLNNAQPNTYTFNVCVKTPEELCALNVPNASFEEPEATTGLLDNYYRTNVVPAWRYNIPSNQGMLYIDALNVTGIQAYDGGQFIQLLTPETAYDPNDLVNIQGLYQDLDSSEITRYDFSFAQATRFPGLSVELWAGPPAGPFEEVADNVSLSSWQLITGTYNVPAGQNITRFIFRAKDNGIGNVLDAVSIIPHVEIVTQPTSLDCSQNSMNLEAIGVGNWTADAANPTAVTFTNASATNTTVNGLVDTGNYKFYWNTRYCQKSITIANVANDEVPVVTTPVTYCQDAVATALTAPALDGYTIVWYDVAENGTPLASAPVPATTTPGTTTYYVAYVNGEGCEGDRAAVEVVVNPTIVPTVTFGYDAPSYCALATAPVITLADGFTTGGTFTATPAGLSINAQTGEINLSESIAAEYQVTYTLDASGCTLAGSYSTTVTVTPAAASVTEFSYATPICLSTQYAILPVTATEFTTGGTYSSATLTVDAVTGQVDVASATAGIHTITYTVANNATTCVAAGTYSFEIEFTTPATAVTGFTYPAQLCLSIQDAVVPTTAIGFTTGGTFSSTTLTVDAVTGQVDVASATAGTHTITYTVAENTVDCIAAGTSSFDIEFTTPATAVTGFTYPAQLCLSTQDAVVPTTATGFTTGGTFSSTTLTVDAVTGQVDVASATAGTHTITYTVAENTVDCIAAGTSSFDIEFTTPATAVTGFTYPAQLCLSTQDAVVPITATGFTTGGTFSSTTLTVDAVTGQVDVASATAGTHTITYTVAENTVDCIAAGTSSFDIEFTTPATAVTGFTYPAQLCLSTQDVVVPTTTTGFTTGGTFSSTTLTVDAVTGQVDVASATAGTHTITYTVADNAALCLTGGTGSFDILFTNPVTPVTAFTFANDYCIAEENPLPATAEGFYTGGTFSADGGLPINATTGEIDLANATGGVYNITYTVNASNCNAGGSTTVSVTITALSTPVASFAYETPACINANEELVPVLPENFTFGGTFASATLTVDAESGVISLASAQAGTHTITYTLAVDAVTCTAAATYTTTVELTAPVVPVTGFSYQTTYCSNSANAVPELASGFTAGGTFTAPQGVVINAETGEINIAQSQAGTYEIKYTVEADADTCNTGGTTAFTITITNEINVTVTQECRGNETWLVATVEESISDSVIFEWNNEAGVTVAVDTPEFNVTNYYNEATMTLPLGFTVTASLGDCTATAQYTVESITCSIPKGISPDNDGLNDSFDLSGMQVEKISIYNRYGREMWHYTGSYTNQWHGQDNNDNELPTGTYFYSLETSGGKKVTGWVYINRRVK
ncbi:choice-of-anchor J domain-containing protein [Flavobacterium sp. RHBU_3]|uniref:choice-of-anchor J domain-containing protein n=1 Tax=Flavobacterium sp. RHBU_3 TaxID=3391184 RepID=UPI003984E4AE